MNTQPNAFPVLPTSARAGTVRCSGYWAVGGAAVIGVGAIIVKTAQPGFDGLTQAIAGLGVCAAGVLTILVAGIVAMVSGARNSRKTD